MNPQVTEKLEQLVKHITRTGDWVLDPKDLKLIKSYCKRSDDIVHVVFDLVMSQLKENHAQKQIRYSSLQLIEQLFDRSKLFRDLLTEDFPLFTQLVVGIQDKKLPPPEQVAKKLKEYAIALIKAWFVKFGEKYRQFGIAFDFLMDHGYLNNDPTLLSSIHASDQSRSGTDARRKAIQLNRYDSLKSDVESHMDIIQDNLKSIEGCFEILIPKNEYTGDDDDFDALLRGEATSHQKRDDSYKETMMSHGLGSSRYKITVNLSEASFMEDIKETADNQIIFDQLREAYTVLETKHISQLNGWINDLIKIEIQDKKEKEDLVSKLINLKATATEDARKAQLLGIKILSHQHIGLQPLDNNTDDDDDDDEFNDELFEQVDVPSSSSIADNQQQQENIPLHSSKLPPLQRIFPLSFEPSMIEDATYSGPQIVDTEQPIVVGKGKQKADPQREELLKRAPIVEWGEDLRYWEEKNVQFNTSGIEFHHRFLGSGEGTNEMPDHLLDELRKRPVYYKSDIPKELQACKHPLNNGSLCPRKDLVTCPFHGKIIPRDELGQPLNPSDDVIASSSSQAPSIMKNLWELIENDVMDQSGHQPIMTRGQKKKKQSTKPKSSLINIKKKTSTSYTRLNRQINSPKTKKMVEESIEYEREMKSRNKEANNWR